MHCLGGRVLKPEILDSLPPEEARASLADLIRINRYWGGYSSLRSLLERAVRPGLTGDERFTLLDVGAASGDMGEAVRRWNGRAEVTSLDYLASHLKTCPGDRVAADAFRLPFAPRSFDFVMCSLFLHHFTDEQVVELLHGFGEAARRAVLVIDLERNPIPYYFMAWSRPALGWDPVTVHDGAISVEAAFHKGELIELARRAGLQQPKAWVWRPAFRIGLMAGAPPRSTIPAG